VNVQNPDAIRNLDAVQSLLTAIVALAGLFYAGMPLLVKRSFRKPAEPGIHSLEDTDRVPADVGAVWTGTRPALEAIGFRSLGGIYIDRLSEGMEAYGLILRHETHPDVALLMSVVFPPRGAYIEFSRDFENGASANTNNGPERPLDPLLSPHKTTFWLPSIDDPAELFGAHTALCKAEVHAPLKNPPDINDPAGRIREDMQQDYAHAERMGLLRYDAASESYVLTLRGAYSLTWMHLWPESTIMRRRRARQDLQKLARAREQRYAQ